MESFANVELSRVRDDYRFRREANAKAVPRHLNRLAQLDFGHLLRQLRKDLARARIRQGLHAENLRNVRRLSPRAVEKLDRETPRGTLIHKSCWRKPMAEAGDVIDPRKIAALLLLTMVLLPAGCQRAEPVAEDGKVAQLHLSLRGEPDNRDGLKTVGRDAGECVRFEPAGLRLTLPAERQGRGNTGLVVSTPVKGDFEITVSFEILKESNPAAKGKQPTKLTLLAVLDSPRGEQSGVVRRTAQSQETDFAAWAIVWNPEREKKQHKFQAFPTTAKTGRLRLVRTGAQMTYYAAEGPDGAFALLRQYPSGVDDLKEVHVLGATGGPNAELDVRVTDLFIRSGAVGSPVADDQRTVAAKRLLAALACVLALAVTFLGTWLYRTRARGRVQVPSP
jgi:hypothetical protein